MKPLLLIGCGGHARSLIDIIDSTGKWQIRGLIGLPNQMGHTVSGHPVIGRDDLPSSDEKCSAAVLAIGQLTDSTPRVRLSKQLEDLGFEIPVLISSHSME